MSNQIIVAAEADPVTVSIARARDALMQARTLQETKHVLDTAAAAEVYAQRQKLGEEAQDLARCIKLEAMRKLGGMLAATQRNTGARGVGKSAVPDGHHTPKLADLGLSKKESATAQKLAALPEQDFQQVRDGQVTLAKAIAQIEPKADKKRRTPVAAPVVEKSAVPDGYHTPEVAEVHGDKDGQPDVTDLLAMLEELQAENAQLRAENAQLKEQVEVLSAADEVKVRLRQTMELLQHAERERDSHMARAHKEAGMHKWKDKQLRLCGKAVGEVEDVRKIVGAVQEVVRELTMFRQGAPQLNTPAALPIVFAADAPAVEVAPMSDDDGQPDYGWDDPFENPFDVRGF